MHFAAAVLLARHVGLHSLSDVDAGEEELVEDPRVIAHLMGRQTSPARRTPREGPPEDSHNRSLSKLLSVN